MKNPVKMLKTQHREIGELVRDLKHTGLASAEERPAGASRIDAGSRPAGNAKSRFENRP